METAEVSQIELVVGGANEGALCQAVLGNGKVLELLYNRRILAEGNPVRLTIEGNAVTKVEVFDPNGAPLYEGRLA